MAIVTTNDQYYHDIADAIREMGVTGTMTPAEMAENILSIESGSDPDYTITVQTASGATVTAVKGDITVTGTAVNRVCVLHVPEAGAYTVTSTYDGTTFTRTVTASTNVDTVMNMAMITDENVNTYLRYASTQNGRWTLEDDVWSIPSSSLGETCFEVLRDVYVRVIYDVDLQSQSSVKLIRVEQAHGDASGTIHTYLNITGQQSGEEYFKLISGDTLRFEYNGPGSADGDIVSMKFEICDCVNITTYSQFFQNRDYNWRVFQDAYNTVMKCYTGGVLVGGTSEGSGEYNLDLIGRLDTSPSKFLVRVYPIRSDSNILLKINLYGSDSDSDIITSYFVPDNTDSEYLLTVDSGQRINLYVYQNTTSSHYSACVYILAQRYY